MGGGRGEFNDMEGRDSDWRGVKLGHLEGLPYFEKAWGRIEDIICEKIDTRCD